MKTEVALPDLTACDMTDESESLRPRLKYRCLADIESVPLTWLWPGKVPSGKLTLFAGDPGLGKSFVTIDMASRVSRGKDWPDGTKNQDAGSVIVLACEDDVSDTIKPRLERANANMNNIYFVDGVTIEDREHGFTLDRHISLLQEMIDEICDVRLVVIDPISAYCGKADTHNNSEVRALLAPLTDLAAESGVAVVAINHLTKGNGNAVYRSTGSIAFVAAARAAWNFYKNPEDESRRLMVPTKMNLAPNATGLSYLIEDGGVRWSEAAVTQTADEIQALAAETLKSSGSAQSALDCAVQFLQEALAGGAVSSKQLIADAKENSIAEKTLRRAFNSIGGKPRKESGKADGLWYWEWPDNGPTALEGGQGSHTSGMAKFGQVGQVPEDDVPF